MTEKQYKNLERGDFIVDKDNGKVFQVISYCGRLHIRAKYETFSWPLSGINYEEFYIWSNDIYDFAGSFWPAYVEPVNKRNDGD